MGTGTIDADDGAFLRRIRHFGRLLLAAAPRLVPALRLLLGAAALWALAGPGVGPRKKTGYVTAAWAAFCTHAYLTPLFPSHGAGLAHAAVPLLAAVGAAVGAALGGLLPRPLGGATLGAGLALAATAAVPAWRGHFAAGGAALALLGGALGTG